MDINVVTGATYRGRFQIDTSGVASFASDSYIKEKMLEELGKNGFADAMVWLESNELPIDWPDAAKSSAGDRTAWVQGKWTKPSGSYPGSGDRWKVIDVWIHIPAPGTCNLEGWTCKFTPCCDGFTCKQDPDRHYGDPGAGFGDPPSRCFPNEGGGIVQVNPPDQKSSNWGWWVLGLGVVGVAGYFAWPSLAGAFSGGKRVARANPTGTMWEIRVNDRRVQWSRQTYKRLFGEGKTSTVIEAETAEEAFKIFSDLHKPGLNPWYFEVKPAPQRNPSKSKTMYFRGAWLPAWPASGAKYEHGPIRMTYEEAQEDVRRGVEWQQHPRGFVLNGRFADESGARAGLRHNMFGNKPPRGVYEIDQYSY